MAVADMSAPDQDAIGAILQRPQYMVGRYSGRTHYPNGTDIGGVLQPADTGQIGRTIGTPVTHKRYYLRFKYFCFHFYFSLFNRFVILCNSALPFNKGFQPGGLGFLF